MILSFVHPLDNLSCNMTAKEKGPRIDPENIQAEKPRKPTKLSELAEVNPSGEEVRELYQMVEELIEKRGEKDGSITARMFVGKVLSYGDRVRVGDSSIPVFLLKVGKDDGVSVDIGMRLGSGEKVRLKLWPGGSVNWIYLARSMVGSGINPTSPTKNDVAMHREVVELLAKLKK